MPQVLTSNGIVVAFDERHFAPLRDSGDVRSDPAELRARYAEDGYVYLPGFLDRGMVLALRQAYFAEFDPGYLQTGTSRADGIFSGQRSPDLPAHGVSGHPAYAFVRGSRFQAFAADPRLAALAATMLGGPVRRLPRAIVRHFDRSVPRASRAHVDYSYLNRGSDQLLTAWIPLGDCPRPTGGLVYLEGTHRLPGSSFDGLRSVTDRPGDERAISHDLGWVADELGRRWRWADYQAGDVTVHSPHIVHASLDTTTDAMRLSADLRYLREGEPADGRWLQAWAGDDGN
ncbi:MAG TPA: phytanoyl-CoA dioxygenase family protein [Acidimicrobiales bacterium]|jgi:ectoine hydroxylase-related dioxygenase (phytanoyl-CoA dioxygenase family)